MHCRRATSFTDMAINCKRREKLWEERKRDTRDGRRCFTVVRHLAHLLHPCALGHCFMRYQRQYHMYYIAQIGWVEFTDHKNTSEFDMFLLHMHNYDYSSWDEVGTDS